MLFSLGNIAVGVAEAPSQMPGWKTIGSVVTTLPVSAFTTKPDPAKLEHITINWRSVPERFRGIYDWRLQLAVLAVVTDPPYYNMIDYLDASDLFYVWFQRALFDVMPDIFGEPGLQDKADEIIVKNGNAPGEHRTIKFYEEMLAKGASIYFDTDEFEDIAFYYELEEQYQLAYEAVCNGLAIHPGSSTQRVYELKGRPSELNLPVVIGDVELGEDSSVWPLAVIRGNAELLQDEIPAPSEEREEVEAIMVEVGRIERIVNNLRVFSRCGLQRVTRFSLGELLDDILDQIGHQIALEPYRIVRGYWGRDREIEGDKDQLRQVFTNLIVNGLQAMEGGGTLTLDLAPDREGAFVSVRIEDRGCGIPDGNLEKLFTPFFSTKPRGTGLGLAVSYGIVKDHGGDIRVENNPEQGATFTVLLPLAQSGITASGD